MPTQEAVGPWRNVIKRAIDLVIAIAALPLALPVLLAGAIAVVLESKGGAFFLQERVGRRGRPFRLVKLRTMVLNAEGLGAGLYGEKDDPRYTQVGKWLRRWSLDELPQIFNVLVGDMSIVGPRPQLRLIVDRYGDDYRVIHEVRPGLTGISQVSGRNGLKRKERIGLDKEYARRWSLAGDLKIIMRTFAVVAGGEGQRNDQSEAEVEEQ